MRDLYEMSLEELHQDLVQMGQLCCEMINATYAALVDESDEALANIENQEEKMNHLERKIEGRCMNLLLLQQPVATDLRKVSSALKMITDMERIGDQACDIAEILHENTTEWAVDKTHIGKMAKTTSKMVADSIDAFIKNNADMAQKVIAEDDDVDALFVKNRDELARGILKDDVTDAQMIDLIMIAKYYERIGDHAANIAEWVIYSVTGEHQE